jgi:hypothetical protein
LTVFVQLRSEFFWNLRTKAAQIDCICSARSEKFAIVEQKQLKIDCFSSAAQRKTLQLANKGNSN